MVQSHFLIPKMSQLLTLNFVEDLHVKMGILCPLVKRADKLQLQEENKANE